MSQREQAVAGTTEPVELTPANSTPETLQDPSEDTPSPHPKRRPVRESGLRGKVVIITGAGAGIGRATAMRFAEEGAKIAAWDVSSKAATQLESAIRWAGGEGCFQTVNVTSAKELEVAAQEVVDRWQRID